MNLGFVDSLTSDKVIHSSQSVQPKSVEAGDLPPGNSVLTVGCEPQPPGRLVTNAKG